DQNRAAGTAAGGNRRTVPGAHAVPGQDQRARLCRPHRAHAGGAERRERIRTRPRHHGKLLPPLHQSKISACLKRAFWVADLQAACRVWAEKTGPAIGASAIPPIQKTAAAAARSWCARKTARAKPVS